MIIDLFLDGDIYVYYIFFMIKENIYKGIYYSVVYGMEEIEVIQEKGRKMCKIFVVEFRNILQVYIVICIYFKNSVEQKNNVKKQNDFLV